MGVVRGFSAFSTARVPKFDIVSGLELSLVVTDRTERGPATVTPATAAAVLVLNSTVTGFAIGRALALLINRLPKHENQPSHWPLQVRKLACALVRPKRKPQQVAAL